MEPLTCVQFPAVAQCWLQGSEVHRLEVVRSFGHDSPYLDIAQYPHVDFCCDENSGMTKTTRENIAERLDYLMKVNPDLSTNAKVEARAGVSKNTVRRLRGKEDVDVSLSNVEGVATAFGLSLAEFVSPPGSSNGLSPDELVLLHKYRQLLKKDKDEVLFFASTKSAINRLIDEGIQGE